MNEEDIKCECGKLYKEKEFKNHFKNCIKLHEKYEEFDAKIIHLLKKYIISKDSLLIIKFFLKRFIKIFDYKLKKIFNIQAIPSIKIENEPHKNLLNSKEIRDKNDIYNKMQNNIKDKLLDNNIFQKRIENNGNQNIVINIPMNNSVLNKNNIVQIIRSNSSNLEDNIKINYMNKIEQIKINFYYIPKKINFPMEANTNEKLVEVIERFKKTICPKWLQNLISVPIYKQQNINQLKTLYEIGIKDGDTIEFTKNNNNNKNNNIINSSDNKNKNNIINNFDKQNNNFIINNFDKQNNNFIINNLGNKNSYNNKINTNFIFNNNFSPIMPIKENNMDDDEEFNLNFIRHSKSTMIPDIEPISILRNDEAYINQHKHNLVYCITLLDWECNICYKNFNKTKAKYYCSLCDYNICVKCYKGNKNIIPEPIFYEIDLPKFVFKAQFFQTENHKHKLVFCIRRESNSNSWSCNICRESHNYEQGSFYCTECDYDMCLNCSKVNLNFI